MEYNVGVGIIPILKEPQRLTASERLALSNPRLSERSECSLLDKQMSETRTVPLRGTKLFAPLFLFTGVASACRARPL